MKTTMYVQVSIIPAPGGFGEWQAQQPEAREPMYPFRDDIIGAARDNANVYELGVDDLPEDVKDIRGHITNEPGEVYAVVDYDGNVTYFGLNSVETEVE